MYLYFIIAFQGYCIYHLLKNRNSYYWIFAILFLPFIGCVTYLVTQVFSKRDTDKVPANLTTIIDPSKKNASSNKVKSLELKLEFADTYLNRINLADGYLESNNYTNAIKHYHIALEDKTQNDFDVKASLIKSYYSIKDYDQVIALSDGLENHKEYEKSEIPFLYGMALAEKDRTHEAEAQLKIMDWPYSNYNERLAFAKFLLRIDKTGDAKKLVEELYVEMQNMIATNKRIYKTTILEVEKLKNTL
ncbi:MAG: TRAFs-binding domain-containing protein [Gelidibacter sp.]